MQIGAYEFSLASSIDFLRNPDRTPLLEYPHLLYDNVKNLKLNKYGAGPFVLLQLTPLPPKEMGVYAVIQDSESVKYIGETDNSFEKRWRGGASKISPRNCYEGGQSTNCRLNTLIQTAIAASHRLELYVLPTPDYERIEEDLINRLQPPWNKKGIRRKV